MHQTIGRGADTLPAYTPSLYALDDAAQTVQTLLLMAQNGLPGVHQDCCVALVCNLSDDQLTWLQEHFGQSFMEQVETAANQDQLDASSIVVQFPQHKLPQLCTFQLRSGFAVFVLQDGHCPLWMRPAVAWEDPDYVQEMHLRERSVRTAQGAPSSASTAPKLSAAEELVQQYGHLSKHSKRRARS